MADTAAATTEAHMKAVGFTTFGGPDVLQPVEITRPTPLPGEILVQVHAVGLNPVDWKTRAGAPTPARAALGAAPHILGWDVSGVVVGLGHGVHRFRVGDEVFGLPWFPRPASAYAEFVTAPSRHFAHKPTTVDHAHAAALPLAGLTAWQALTEVVNLRPGQRVLIHAAGGGVGHLAVQIAKTRGAHVVASASAAKHEWLLSLGADEVVDYGAVRFEDVVRDMDVVLDLVGDMVDLTTTRSVGVLVRGGTLVCVAPGASPDLPQLASEAGVTLTPPMLVEPDGDGLSKLAELIDDEALSVTVEHVYPLADVAAAHAQGEKNRTAGKIVLSVIA